MANVLQTKVDAHCDKLATKLSWQRSRQSTFSSYSELSMVANFSLPLLHFVPPLGVTPFEFYQDMQKTRVPGLWCGIVSGVIVSVEHGLMTDRQTQTDRQLQHILH